MQIITRPIFLHKYFFIINKPIFSFYNTYIISHTFQNVIPANSKTNLENFLAMFLLKKKINSIEFYLTIRYIATQY